MLIRTRIIELSENLRSSYWFLPTLLACAGFALGLLLVLVDARLGDTWLGQYEWFYGSRPEGARAMLSTIAGSTITVAGVVFSITLAAVTYASGQFGPRLLGNFMRDRGNQASLGVFIGTYLYCLVVLRTIRSAEETSADTGGAVRDAFVPHVAMFGGLALAIASTAVLIYFVHHVTSGIHINNVIARVGRDLIDQIRQRSEEGDTDSKTTSLPSLAGQLKLILATKNGYIEAIDYDALLQIAWRHELVLRPVRRAGDFVVGRLDVAGGPFFGIDFRSNDGGVHFCYHGRSPEDGPARSEVRDRRTSRDRSPGAVPRCQRPVHRHRVHRLAERCAWRVGP